MTARVVTPADARRLLSRLESNADAMAALLGELIEEGGTDTARGRLERTAKALRSVGMRVTVTSANGSTHLVGHAGRRAAGPCQVVMGQVGRTPGPAKLTDSTVAGPDARHLGGVVQAVFALWALNDADVVPPVRPVMLVLSGAEGAADVVAAVGRNTDRIFVVGPSEDGRVITARPGGVTLTFAGNTTATKAAISDLSAVLGNFGDEEGTVEIMGRSSDVAKIDLRSWSAAGIQSCIEHAAVVARNAGVEVTSSRLVPPMDRSNGARVLWWRAVAAAGDMGIGLAEQVSGEPSTTNLAGILGPALDGLGSVGGTRAGREWVDLAMMAERTALLARLLVDPPLSEVVCAE